MTRTTTGCCGGAASAPGSSPSVWVLSIPRCTTSTAFSPRCFSGCGCQGCGPLPSRRISVVLDVIIIGCVVVAINYVVQAAARAIIDPAFRSQVLEPQERSCVIRNDVCKLVDWLRSNAATTFDIGPGLTPEVTQRLVEFAFPIRVMRDAPVRV